MAATRRHSTVEMQYFEMMNFEHIALSGLLHQLYTLASATPTLATEVLDPSRGLKDLVYIEVVGRVIADHHK